MKQALFLVTVIALPGLPALAGFDGTAAGIYYCEALEAGRSHDSAIKYAYRKARSPSAVTSSGIVGLEQGLAQYINDTQDMDIEASKFEQTTLKLCPQFFAQ